MLKNKDGSLRELQLSSLFFLTHVLLLSKIVVKHSFKLIRDNYTVCTDVIGPH